MASDRGDDSRQPNRFNRRDFLAIGGAGIAGAALAPDLARAARTPAAYPEVDVAPLADIAPGAEVAFEYPDDASPAILLRLAEKADGGVGPEGDIVAFSLLCTHKGCPLNYLADRKMLVCPCHWSSFDPAKAGRLVIGQASQSLPQIRLRVDGDRVRAVGVDGLIYGRHTNIL